MGVLNESILSVVCSLIASYLFVWLSKRITPDPPPDPPQKAVASRPRLLGSPGLRVDGRFELKFYMEQSTLSERWLGLDHERGDEVVVYLLHRRWVEDQSVVKHFVSICKEMGTLWAEGVPPTRYGPVQVEVLRTYCYVRERSGGTDLLSLMLARDPEVGGTARLNGVIQIAEALRGAHQRGIFHAAITPKDILVHDGRWRLVSYELAGRLPEGIMPVTVPGSFEYSPLERLDGSPIDARSDIYNLARLVIVLYGYGQIETPFERTNGESIDWLNCGIPLKNILRQATCSKPLERHGSLLHFVQELRSAINFESSRAALLGFLSQEREKVARVLMHSVLGTLAVMLPIRFVVTLVATVTQSRWGLVQLSDRPIVGAFHGIIGSVVWGSLISFGVLLAWPLHLQFKKWMPLAAGICCGGVAWLGGVVCSYLSVQVTSLEILKHLGWLTGSAVNTNRDRLVQTMSITHMFWAYPMVGMLTGIGCGIFIALHLQLLLSQDVPGLEPLPAKVYRRRKGCLESSMALFTRRPYLITCLMTPIIFSPLVASRFHAVGVPYQGEWWRTLGEAFVQFVGSIGLVGGFFYGVAEPSNRRSRLAKWIRSMVARVRR